MSKQSLTLNASVLPGDSGLDDPALYLNRELSQLDFNQRVLAQAMDARIPLLERLRFLCISFTNLDEFFEIRVASIHQAQEWGLAPNDDGMTPAAVLRAIHKKTTSLAAAQYSCWNKVICPALCAAGIRFIEEATWTARQRRWLRAYFHREIIPVLSPQRIDHTHPFPKILNKTLNIIVSLEGADAFGRDGALAVVRAPRLLPRVIALPTRLAQEGEMQFVFLSSVIVAFIDDLFTGMQVKGAHPFRVTRNSELLLDEKETQNLASAMQQQLIDRGYFSAVRLEVDAKCPDDICQLLLRQFSLKKQALYRSKGPINLSRALHIYDIVDRPDLKYPTFIPRLHIFADALFDTIRQRDILLHHPFDAFDTVLDFLQQAANDPDVLVIKQTLYRTDASAQIVNALIHASRSGKDVTVVVELRARFDEEANLGVASMLQHAGVQVIFGVVGHKTHAKMLMVLRREGARLRRYVHLGSGNYHSATARAYTDLSLMTADQKIGQDVHHFFLQIAGTAPVQKMHYLLQSPFTLHTGLLERIEREARIALGGGKGRIIAKLNALNEPKIIRALYRASQAGVTIDLVVRGACALRPQVPGISETIRVRSIIGRFLEHSRVYWFANDGAPELFCASADWLERNLLWRVEACFPILDPDIARHIFRDVLQNYLDDNVDAWELTASGTYHKITPTSDVPVHSAQKTLLQRM